MKITTLYNPFTRESAKSKPYKFSKITNWLKLKNKQHHSSAQQLSNEWSHLRVLSIESKVGKVCAAQWFHSARVNGVQGATEVRRNGNLVCG